MKCFSPTNLNLSVFLPKLKEFISFFFLGKNYLKNVKKHSGEYLRCSFEYLVQIFFGQILFSLSNFCSKFLIKKFRKNGFFYNSSFFLTNQSKLTSFWVSNFGSSVKLFHLRFRNFEIFVLFLTFSTLDC
jgi:hypothetical protein